MEITWRTSRNSENVAVVRAEIGLKWATFSFSGELLQVGEGRCCAPSEVELAQMIAEAPAAIDAVIATEAPAKPARPAYRPGPRRHFDNRYDMRPGMDVSLAMEFEDSAL